MSIQGEEFLSFEVLCLSIRDGALTFPNEPDST